MTIGYYIRHLIFASALFAFAYVTQKQHMTMFLLMFFTVNTLLYPLARYLYDLVMGFILGDSMFILPALISFIYQMFLMLILFFLAWLIAPISVLIILFNRYRYKRLD